VAFKAAANLYRLYAAKVNSADATRFEALASRFETEFERLVKIKRMPYLYDRVGIDWDWAK
jgi:hypothetical protein